MTDLICIKFTKYVWHVEKQLLLKIPYLRSIIEGNWKESNSSLIDLTGTSADGITMIQVQLAFRWASGSKIRPGYYI